jgi:hypothetical protein
MRKISDRMSAGIPDYLGTYDGHFVALELKAPGKKLTSLQSLNLTSIVEVGGEAVVCHSLEEVQGWVSRIEKRYGPTRKQR